MKSLMSLYASMLQDADMWCCTSTIRDLKTVTERVEHEGLSFLTITLPSFASDFERSLETGSVDHTMFLSFKKRGALPLFLGGLLDQVFNRSDGRLLLEPSSTGVFFIRQLTLLFKKIKLKCSDARERHAFAGYYQCEREVERWSQKPTSALLERYEHLAGILWSGSFGRMGDTIQAVGHIPKHGPGATADRLTANGKYGLAEWTLRLEEFFPSADFVIPNYGYYENLACFNYSEPGAERPSKVISVPKTLKTPRIIAVEPTCMQYAQQSLLEMFVDAIENQDPKRDDFLFGSIGFTDQTPNQRMACTGSKLGSFATIDLSEASDRVSNQLVKLLFKSVPVLSGAVQACRTSRADVPGYGVIPLFKYASMGSATCFPVMAMVILTAVVMGYEDSLSRTITRKDIKSFLPKVRIYGDDIIVPTELVRFVVSSLEAIGLKVNARKSFWTGKFRESCGKDYFDGDDVSVTYCRQLLPSQRSDVDEMVSAYSFRNQLYKAGLWKSAETMDNLLRSLAPLPVVLNTSPVLGRFSFLGYQTDKTSKELHSPLVRGLVVTPKPRKSVLDDHGALLKFFLKRGLDPLQKKHLQYYGRPVAVDIKLRWSSPL